MHTGGHRCRGRVWTQVGTDARADVHTGRTGAGSECAHR